MTDNALLIHHANAPAPLEPFRREVISPANIALEQRVKQARALTTKNVRGLKRQVRRLEAKLRDYEALKQERQKLLGELRGYKQTRKIVQRCRATLATVRYTPSQTMTALMTAVKLDIIEQGLNVHVRGIIHRGRQVDAQLDTLAPLYQQYRELTQTIEAYQIAKQRAAMEAALYKDLAEEARIYARYIRLTWSQLPACHHRFINKKGKTVVETPQFARVSITPDAIYFKLLASFKGYFGWKSGLPYGVYVKELIDERTLQNISVACQRQVSAIENHHGIWVVVNRLNSPDGLMDYLKYSQVQDYYPDHIKGDMPVCVGVGLHRTLKWINFTDFPHWMISGWTGGGKSNIINVIICTLASHHPPADLRIALIDLKGGLEFTHYEGLPHLVDKIVTNIEGVAGILEQLEGEMIRRFELFRPTRAKSIEVYNARVDEDKRQPRIILFFDEFASVVKQGDLSKRIQSSVMQIAARGRAVGIHLVVCTQHPSVDIIPGNIKTNLTVRLTGRMPTTSASVTTLGAGDAKDLPPIPGRMMLMIGPDPEAIQTPHIEDVDIAKVLHKAREFPAAPLQLPEGRKHQQWTAERLIDFSIRHLGGNLAGTRLYPAIEDDNISRRQVFGLLDEIYEMPQPIIYRGKPYRLEKRSGGGRWLVPMESNGAKG